jgi:hypothetical protein
MPLIGWQPPSHQVESSQAPAPQAECETATGSLPIATGPPHPCGGSLHFTALYLLTRGRDKTWGIRGFATLRAGLDQLAPSGPFVGRGHRRCALRRRRRPRPRGADVPYANGPNGPTCLVHRYQTAGSHPAKTPALRRSRARVAGSRHARRVRATHPRPRGGLVAPRRHEGGRDPRAVRRGALGVLPAPRPAPRRGVCLGLRPGAGTPAAAPTSASAGQAIGTPARELTARIRRLRQMGPGCERCHTGWS